MKKKDKRRENLIKEAEHFIDYFEGKLIADMLRAALEANDMKRVENNLFYARQMAYDLEYNREEAR